MSRSFLTLLLCGAVLLASGPVSFAKTTAKGIRQSNDSKVDKFRKQVAKIGVGGKITVRRTDDREFFGKVRSIEADGFQVDEVALKQTFSFKYTDVKKIKTGDGERNLITGRRVNPKKGWLYGLAIFGTLAVILGIGLADKDF